jgi:hypothetical protein
MQVNIVLSAHISAVTLSILVMQGSTIPLHLITESKITDLEQ